jgi:hypothetical protein
MLSAGEIAIIVAEIKRLEKARKDCRDRGIQKQIDVWIEAQKQKLASENHPKVERGRKPGGGIQPLPFA